MIARSDFRQLIYSNIFRCAVIGVFWLGPISGRAADMDQLLAQSEFVFKGTVQKVKATTMAAVPATDKTVVVKVDEILQGSDALRAFLGQEVTVLLTGPATGKAGDQGIYFTKGWLYGESIALVEVGKLPTRPRTAAQPALAQQKAQVTTALAKLGDKELRARLTTSDLVVSGKVTSVNPPKNAAAALQDTPHSEHDPMFLEATIQVERTEKGKLADKTIQVFFPSSRDVMWSKAPKLKPGQEGTFILHSNEMKEVTAAMNLPKAYTLLKPKDFQPKERQPQVRQLLQSLH